MKVFKSGDVDELPGEVSATISGVGTLHPLGALEGPPRASVAVVEFEASSRTHWHSHPGGQVLVVLNGAGQVGDDTETVDLGEGDIVVSDPDERHWHGAGVNGGMSHLAISSGATSWFEPVE